MLMLVLCHPAALVGLFEIVDPVKPSGDPSQISQRMCQGTCRQKTGELSLKQTQVGILTRLRKTCQVRCQLEQPRLDLTPADTAAGVEHSDTLHAKPEGLSNPNGVCKAPRAHAYEREALGCQPAQPAALGKFASSVVQKNDILAARRHRERPGKSRHLIQL